MKKNKLTVKNYSIGVLIGIVVMMLIGWINSGFSIKFFTNWVTLLTAFGMGLAFSLILVPFIIMSWTSGKLQKKKNIPVLLAMFVVFIAFDLLFGYFTGIKINLSSIISDIIAILIIFAVL